MLKKVYNLIPGLLFSAGIAIIAMFLSSFIPGDIIGATVMALLLGMSLNPILNKYKQFNTGVNFSGKIVLRIGINCRQIFTLCNDLYYGNRIWCRKFNWKDL